MEVTPFPLSTSSNVLVEYHTTHVYSMLLAQQNQLKELVLVTHICTNAMLLILVEHVILFLNMEANVPQS